MPAWLEQLSPDGAQQILLAFGRLVRGGERLSSSDATRVLSPVEMGAVLARALERLEAPLQAEAEANIGSVVDLARLERLSRFGVTQADRDASQHWLRQLRHESPMHLLRHAWRAGAHKKGQLELFGDGSVC